jgi:hypothetical protein
MRLSDQEAEAYLQLKLDQLPRWIGNPIRQLRRDGRLWLRTIAAALLMLGGLLWFLPVLGIWMLPLGLLLLAGEFPALKRWLVGMAMRVERWLGRSGPPPL